MLVFRGEHVFVVKKLPKKQNENCVINYHELWNRSGGFNKIFFEIFSAILEKITLLLVCPAGSDRDELGIVGLGSMYGT